jgi:hypothetical protein
MTSVIKPRADQDKIRRLNTLLERAGASSPPAHSHAVIPTGCEALNRFLPQGGWRRGSLVEWLSDPTSGAGTLALVAARQAHGAGGAVVVIDRHGTFYPPAAAAWRLDLAGVIVVHPDNDKDEQWALDQALRCEHTAAVLAWPRRLDGRTFRRLQLAAEASGAVGFFVRPMAAEREPSWADVRLAVAPRASPGDEPSSGWQLGVRLLRCRGRFGKKEGEVVVEIDHQTGEIHEARSCHLAAELERAAIA